jgi:DNA-binding transcriptional ArsR family regulator
MGMDKVFKAIADPSGRKLLDRLHGFERTVRHLDMTRQAVAKHLALLESANLICTMGGARTYRTGKPARRDDGYTWLADGSE